MTNKKRGRMSKTHTTAFGIPVAEDQSSLTAGERGPVLMQEAGRYPFTHPNDDFVQAGNRYQKAMTDEDRGHLIGNMVDHLGGAQKRIQLRQAAVFYKADADYGSRVANGLGLDVKELERLAAMSQEERAKATAP